MHKNGRWNSMPVSVRWLGKCRMVVIINTESRLGTVEEQRNLGNQVLSDIKSDTTAIKSGTSVDEAVKNKPRQFQVLSHEAENIKAKR